MTTLTIKIPDGEVSAITNIVKEKGGEIVKKTSAAQIKRSQLLSLEKSLKEAILISMGDIEGHPLSKLWH